MSSVEDAGVIEGRLRLNLTQMEKDALDAQKKMDALAAEMKAKGLEAGDGFSDGFNKGKTKYDLSLKTMKANMASLGPWGASVGNKLANGLSKPVIAAVPKMALAFRSLQAAMGPVMIVVGLVTSAAMAIKGFLDKQNEAAREAKAKQEELNRSAEQTEGIYNRLARSTGDVSRNLSQMEALFSRGAGAAIRETASNLEGVNQALRTARNDLNAYIRDMNDNVASGTWEVYKEEYERMHGTLESVQQRFRSAYSDYYKAAADYRQVQEQTANSTAEQMDEYQKIVDERILAELTIQGLLEHHAISEKEAAEAKISALNNFINKANEFSVSENLNNRLINNTIREQVAIRNNLIESTRAGQSTQQKIDEARLAAIAKYEQAVQRANDARAAGLIDEIELENQKAAALSAQYSDLESIVLQYDLAAGKAGELGAEVMRLRDTAAEELALKQGEARLLELQKSQAVEIWQARAAAAKTEKERNQYLQLAIDAENELMRNQRLIERNAIEMSATFQALSEEDKEKILSDFDEITKAREKTLHGKNQNWLAEMLGMTDQRLGEISQVGEASLDALNNIADAAMEITRAAAEEKIAIIEEALRAMMEQIEIARQAELEAQGFARATTEEEIQKQIDRAKEAGDEVLQYKLNRRKEEIAINKKYDDMAKAAEEKAAKEKADIEYKLAKETHAMQIIQAANAAAMAVLQALQSAWPPTNFILAGIVGTAAAVQIGMLAANPPKPPRFASGGIVPGRKSDGDAQHVIATAGEVILNEAQQGVVANKLTSGNGYTELTVVIQLDGREIAQTTADVFGSGMVLVPARGVAR